MDYVSGYQEENPYVVGLKSGIEASLCEFVCEELYVSKDCFKSIVEEKDGNIKALAVALPYYFINTKVFPFPIFDLC